MELKPNRTETKHGKQENTLFLELYFIILYIFILYFC